MAGKKDGLATKEEIKILWKVASGYIPIPVMVRPLANLFIPNLIDGLDNKYGDRIPEPWQTHCENLVTLVVHAVEDGVISQSEAEEIAEYAATVINEKVNLPLVNEDVQELIFIETIRMLAVFLYGLISKEEN